MTIARACSSPTPRPGWPRSRPRSRCWCGEGERPRRLHPPADPQAASAIRIVARGEAIVAPRATSRLLHELLPAVEFDAAGVLTDREVGIARLVGLGLSNEDAAAAAGISRATVKTHVSNILLKLGCTSRLQIAVWAYEHGVVRVGEGLPGRPGRPG